MAQLTKGMYGHEFKSQSNLFGLRCGQMRSGEMVHNGGWYNKVGEKLGWGDLSGDDFKKIYAELEDDEMFIILHESDSFWNFVTKPGLIGSMAQVKPDVNAPGVEYVADRCAYVIDKEGMHVVDRDGWYAHRGQTTITHQHCVLTVISKEAVKALLGVPTAEAV